MLSISLNMSFQMDDIMENYRFSPDIDNYANIDCTYNDINVYSQYMHQSFLNILKFNVRSMRKNFSNFLSYFSCVLIHFSLIFLTEIWLDSDSSDTFNIPGFYKFDLCRNNLGGGLRVFVREGIQVSVLTEFTVLND